MDEGSEKIRGLSDSARRWGIGRSTLSELLRSGQIAYVRLPGGERRIPDGSVREWVNRNLVRGVDDAEC
jgi:excisionase family DNA binding protein